MFFGIGNCADMLCWFLQQQGYPGAPPPYQQYYQGYPSYSPYPYPQQKSASGGLPFYVWIGVGALVMWAYSKISGLVRGGPQAAQAKMMSWVSISAGGHRKAQSQHNTCGSAWLRSRKRPCKAGRERPALWQCAARSWTPGKRAAPAPCKEQCRGHAWCPQPSRLLRKACFSLAGPPPSAP